MSASTGVCMIIPSGKKSSPPRVFGMGIVVSDREIVTCAHVINAALGRDIDASSPPTDKVTICFPLAEGYPCARGTVDKNRWLAPGRTGDGSISDIAVIQLDEDAPASVGRAMLREHDIDSNVTAYGFRGKLVKEVWRSHPTGEWSDCKIMGPLPGGRVQIDGLRITGAVIEKGFSGAAVYWRARDAVVGMVVESDKEEDKAIAQFIDMPSLWKALGGTPAIASPIAVRTTSLEILKRTRELKQKVETYLREVGELLLAPDPGDELLPYLQTILDEDTPNAGQLRAAFGFPKAVENSRSVYKLVASNEAYVQPFLGILAQRINTLMWRFQATLKDIRVEWTEKALRNSFAVSSLCDPHVLVRQPALLDLLGAPKIEDRLKAISEPAADAPLYAVLRAISHAQHHALPVEDAVKNEVLDKALDFVYEYLDDLVAGRRVMDDSSNAWWGVREGLFDCGNRPRGVATQSRKDVQLWIGLLTRVAEKFNDVRISPEHVTRLAAVPEIYKPIRTTSYTLSNIQAIFEDALKHDFKLEDSLKQRLHQVIQVMLERLLNAPTTKQLYLASVHHEGLRNYLDYVEDQKLSVK